MCAYQSKFTRFGGAPLTYFDDGGWGGGGDVRMIFLDLKYWPKVILGVHERCLDFYGSRKKTGIFLG